MNTGSGGAVPTVSLLDYLTPTINRPDIFEERSFIVKDISGKDPGGMKRRIGAATHPSNKSKCPTSCHSKLRSVFYTIGLILISAMIFIIVVAWADVLRSWLDSIYINNIIAVQTRSRIYYASIITGIALVVTVAAVLIYLRSSKF